MKLLEDGGKPVYVSFTGQSYNVDFLTSAVILLELRRLHCLSNFFYLEKKQRFTERRIKTRLILKATWKLFLQL